MSYLTYETSVDSGQPIEVYEFIQGANYTYYTNAPDDIEILGITYVSTQINRASVEVTSEVSKSELKLELPRDSQLAIGFLGQLTDTPTTIVVKRVHMTDVDLELNIYWRGRVVSAKAVGHLVELTCESIFTSMKRHGVRARYQRNCRHTLFSYDCGLSQTAWETNGTILGVSGTIVTIAEAALQVDGYYVGGMIRIPGGGSRLITNHVGVDLTLNRYLDAFVAGASVKITPGCDHLRTTCTNKFNNIENFGGFPFMPLKNPFGGTSLV